MNTPVDITSLNPPGQASIAKRNGTVTVLGNNALKALQLIVAQGNIRIQLTQNEIDDLLAAGKLQISVNFSLNDPSSASQAAQQIVSIANAALEAKRNVTSHGRMFRKIVLAAILMVVVVIVFLSAIRLLDAMYGTHQLGLLLARF